MSGIRRRNEDIIAFQISSANIISGIATDVCAINILCDSHCVIISRVFYDRFSKSESLASLREVPPFISIMCK